MAKQYYFIDFSLLTWRDLPVLLRQPQQHAWVKCLAEPVRLLWAKFNVNKTVNEYYLAHNSQVCYMEGALNDTFDNTLRRIFISDPQYFDPVYVYQEAEVKPVYIDTEAEIGTFVIDDPDPVPLYLESETSADAVDFIVNVPSALVFDTDRMVALIDKYRLPSKNSYIIQTF